MPVDDLSRRDRRCIRDRWAYLVRFALLELWCAGQVAVLRLLHGVRGIRSERLRLGFTPTRRGDEAASSEAGPEPRRSSTGAPRGPQRRLKVIARRMPERKGDLVELIRHWSVPTPDDPGKMRIPDLREILFEFDRAEERRNQNADEYSVLERWGQKHIAFGEKHFGHTFAQAYEDRSFTRWVLEAAKFRNKAMQDFANYATTRKAQRDLSPADRRQREPWSPAHSQKSRTESETPDDARPRESTPEARMDDRTRASPSANRAPRTSRQGRHRRGRSSSMSDEK